MVKQTGYKHSDITERIIGAFYSVYGSLGYGFLEKVYRNAILIELHQVGLEAVVEQPIEVFYRNQLIGHYFTDLVVNGKVIVELKTVERLLDEHEAQILNYLKATSYEIGLLLNFGPKPEVKRKIFDNNRKGTMDWLQKSNTASPLCK